MADSLGGLESLWLQNTAVSNSGLSAIGEGLQNLKYLCLGGAQITDITPLASLPDLEVLDLAVQELSLEPGVADVPVDTPVRDVDGNAVAVDSSDSGFSYDVDAQAWVFTDPGAKVLT